MSATSYKTKNGLRWRYRIYNPETKKTEGGGAGFATRAEAIEAEVIARAGGTIDPEAITCGEWQPLWLQTADIGEATALHYAERTSPFVARYGSKPLLWVGRPLALEWFASGGQGIQELSAMWSAAAAVNLVPEGENPWTRLMSKRGRKIQPGWFVARDLGLLIEAGHRVHGPIYGSVMEALILVGGYVGLRPGELAGLRWIDLRPDEEELHVGQQAHTRLGKMQPPKGGYERDAAYPQVAIDAVARMPRLHDELVFVSKRGKVLYGPNRNTIWSPVRAAAGRYTMRMHELRHYTATTLLERGLSSADAATQLGHRDGGRLIESTYGHPRTKPALDRVRAALADAAEEAKAAVA